VNGRPVTIVGVLPEGFIFPAGPADILLPNVIDPTSPGGRSSHYVSMIGRIEGGGGVETAQSRVSDLAARWAAEYPGRHGISPTHPLTLVPLRESLVGDARSALLVLMGVVGLVLLIASANVAALMLVRIEHRQSETAVRAALGAGVRGVVTPFLAECAVLAVLGAGLGVAVAAAAVRAVEIWGPAGLTRVGDIRIDGWVLGFTAVTAAGSALLFGLIPTLMATRRDVAGQLRGGGRGSIAGRPRTAVRTGLVVAEVALAMVVVTGAGLLLRSFTKLRAVEPGLDPSGVVTMDFSLSTAEYPTMADVAAFHAMLEERLAAIPGVVAAGSIRALPFASTPGVESMAPTDRALDTGEHWNAQYQVVGPDVFEALGVPLLAGRPFNTADREGTTPVAMINAAMADAYWPGASPLGDRVKLGPRDGPNPVLTIVGVVGNVRQDGYRDEISPQLFVPISQAGAIYNGLGSRFATLAVRSALPASAALATARATVRDLDPRLPVANERTMSAAMSRTVTDERFLTGLVGLFSLLALTLGAVGVGGLVAYTVERRTRELGLRIALGADRHRILGRLLTGAAALAASGAAIGLIAALAGGRVLEAHLFEISTTDPLVLVAAPATLVVAAFLAALLPARRAMRIPPTEAMRAD
jgi:predicted permease